MVKYVGKHRRAVTAEPRDEGWEAYFDAGEHLIWQGRPNTGLRFNAKSLIESVFGVFFLGFSVFWMVMASVVTSRAPQGFDPFALFGIPFVAFGLYMVIGKYFWQAFLRGRTRYALTNKRAFIATRSFRKQLGSWPINFGTELVYQPGNESTVFFATSTRRTATNKHNRGSKYKTIRHGFEYFNEGEKVYRLMRDLIAKGGKA